MTLSTTTKTEHHLTKALEKKADAIAVRVSSVEKEMEQICMDVATDCEGLEEGSAFAYLFRAFPNVPDKGNRNRFLRAGLMLHESSRRRLPMPPWTVAAEAYALPPAGHEWFFSQEKPPTRQEVRDWKKEHKQKEAMTDQEVAAFNGMVDLIEEQQEQINHLTAKQTTTPENNVRLHQQPEQPPSGGHPGNDSGERTNEQLRDLAAELDRQSGEPEGYLQAAHMLREVSHLLEYAKQEGWSEAAFGALRDDAESIARSCAACSDNRRERAHQAAKEEWANKFSPALRSDRGVSLLGGTSSELDEGSLG